MNKEDIKDAILVSASAVVGSEIADSVITEIQEQTIDEIDVIPCVYGPPSGIIDDDIVDIYDPNPEIIEFESENIVSDIDDFEVVYGPPPGIIDHDF